MVDSERGFGLLGRSVDRSTLPTDVRVELAIAMSGARLDLGEPDRALLELDIPELDPDRAFEWSPGLFSARAAVLEELGRADEAARWQQRAVVAADAIDAATGAGDLETVFVDEVIEEADEEIETAADEAEADDAETVGADDEDSEFPSDEQPVSVEDEVAEILADAGIDDDPDGAEGGEPEGDAR